MSVTSADEQAVHRFYAAIVDRDMAAAESCFAPDAVWYLPGKSAIAGEHRGWSAIRDGVLAKLGPLSGGTLRIQLLDIAVGEEFAVAFPRKRAPLTGGEGRESGDVRLDGRVSGKDPLGDEAKAD